MDKTKVDIFDFCICSKTESCKSNYLRFLANMKQSCLKKYIFFFELYVSVFPILFNDTFVFLQQFIFGVLLHLLILCQLFLSYCLSVFRSCCILLFLFTIYFFFQITAVILFLWVLIAGLILHFLLFSHISLE